MSEFLDVENELDNIYLQMTIIVADILEKKIIDKSLFINICGDVWDNWDEVESSDIEKLKELVIEKIVNKLNSKFEEISKKLEEEK